MDKPGVLHAISEILSDLDISVDSFNQKGHEEGKFVPIFLVTHQATEKNIREAVKRIENWKQLKMRSFSLDYFKK